MSKAPEWTGSSGNATQAAEMLPNLPAVVEILQSSGVSLIDMHVGNRIRECRELRDVTQQQLADVLGVPVLRIKHHEHGLDRVPAARLIQIAQALETPVARFFEGIDSVDQP